MEIINWIFSEAKLRVHDELWRRMISSLIETHGNKRLQVQLLVNCCADQIRRVFLTAVLVDLCRSGEASGTEVIVTL